MGCGNSAPIDSPATVQQRQRRPNQPNNNPNISYQHGTSYAANNDNNLAKNNNNNNGSNSKSYLNNSGLIFDDAELSASPFGIPMSEEEQEKKRREAQRAEFADNNNNIINNNNNATLMSTSHTDSLLLQNELYFDSLIQSTNRNFIDVSTDDFALETEEIEDRKREYEEKLKEIKLEGISGLHLEQLAASSLATATPTNNTGSNSIINNNNSSSSSISSSYSASASARTLLSPPSSVDHHLVIKFGNLLSNSFSQIAVTNCDDVIARMDDL